MARNAAMTKSCFTAGSLVTSPTGGVSIKLAGEALMNIHRTIMLEEPAGTRTVAAAGGDVKPDNELLPLQWKLI